MVAPALIGALVGAGYGALTYEDQKRQADAMRKANATIESTSPWTGVHGKVVQGPSLLGNVAGGALSGASFGMNDAFKSKPETAVDTTPVTTNTPGGAGQAGATLTQMPGSSGVQGGSPWSFQTTPDGNNVQYPGQVSTVGPGAYYGSAGGNGYSPWRDINTQGGGRWPERTRVGPPGYMPPGGY